jgi:hypothetical protein
MPPACKFSFNFEGSAEDLVTKAEQAITEAGGQFAGDDKAGKFMVDTPLGEIRGTYTIEGQTFDVLITKKPLLVSCNTIEKTIRKLLEALVEGGSVAPVRIEDEQQYLPQDSYRQQQVISPEQQLVPWLEAVGKTDLATEARALVEIIPEDKRAGTSEAELESLARKELDYAISSQLKQRVRTEAQKKATELVPQEARAAAPTVAERLKQAGQAVKDIADTGEAEVDAILASSAKLMRKKYLALVGAGFEPEQAMLILLAEIGKNKR